MALKAQYEDAARRNFPLKSAPVEPEWDRLSKEAPAAFADYFAWARGEWARINKEAGSSAYPAAELDAALAQLSEAQQSLFSVQAEALKSLETFVPWQEGTERVMDKFFREGNLYLEEYLAVNPVFRERIDQEIMEGNTYGALDCLPISEGYEQASERASAPSGSAGPCGQQGLTAAPSFLGRTTRTPTRRWSTGTTPSTLLRATPSAPTARTGSSTGPGGCGALPATRGGATALKSSVPCPVSRAGRSLSATPALTAISPRPGTRATPPAIQTISS